MSSTTPDSGETPGSADPAPVAAPGPDTPSRPDATQAAPQLGPSRVGGIADLGSLRPEDLTAEGIPTAMRGYDRRRVESLLRRVSEAYAHVTRQRNALRERTRLLETEVAAAEGEARISAASVADLAQRLASAEDELARAREPGEDVRELERRLAAAEDEREQALADLRSAAERAAAHEERVRAFEEAEQRRAEEAEAAPSRETVAGAPSSGPDQEAAALLLAAVRAAEELRQSSRARALATLKRVRERAASVEAEVEREQSALVEMQERRRDAERVASDLLAQARAESDRVAAERRESARLAAELGDERSRVRTLLAGALSALDPDGTDSQGLLADLSSRLPDAGERDDAVAPGPEPDQGQ